MYIYTIFYLSVVNSDFAIDNRLSIATSYKLSLKSKELKMDLYYNYILRFKIY